MERPIYVIIENGKVVSVTSTKEASNPNCVEVGLAYIEGLMNQFLTYNSDYMVKITKDFKPYQYGIVKGE